MHSDIATLFLAHSRNKLWQMCEHIEACLIRLSDDQIWSRGAAHENSIGNLVLHLCGNAQQWICAGVGGEQDIRDREREFSARGGLSGADLISHLKQTTNRAVATLDGVTAARLWDEINPQTGPVSVLEAIYQVVGHFQQHTGQIIFATKILAGEDLGLYRPPSSSR
jgi:uncharacterized damage-inducible protein DinB